MLIVGIYLVRNGMPIMLCLIWIFQQNSKKGGPFGSAVDGIPEGGGGGQTQENFLLSSAQTWKF